MRAILSIRQVPRLFCLWGHVYEFDKNNNWDKIEEICSKISGKEDTWYAVNIEIYEYTKAYNSLFFSADGCRIYNPTLNRIWFSVDGNEYSVAPGEALKTE